MEKEIQKDYRRHTPKGNLKDRYVNVKQWKESKLARDIEETVELLPVTVRAYRLMGSGRTMNCWLL